jgi:hypothetical protein
MQRGGDEVSMIRTTMQAQQGQLGPYNVSNGTSVTRARTPSWQWQRGLRIDDGDKAMVTRATTPAWQWQQCHCNEGNNIIAMITKMPGLQRHLRIDNGNTIVARAMMPTWQQQRRLRIDDGNNPIAIRTTTPAWWLC